MKRGKDQSIEEFMKFIFEAPDDMDCIQMDCDDYNESVAWLAEQVAAGKDIGELRPKLDKFMRYWCDCREEFEALVEILRAEQRGDINKENP